MDPLWRALEPLSRGCVSVTTGAILPQKDKYLLAGYLEGETLHCFGIGGRPLPGETLLQALVREGREEAGLVLVPRDSCRTFFYVADQLPEVVTLSPPLSPRPALVWRGAVSGEAGEPSWLGVAWEADFFGEPRPAAEIELLARLDPGFIAGEEDIGDPEIIGSQVLPEGGMSLIGSARYLAEFLRGDPAPWGQEISESLEEGREIMGRMGASGALWQHSRGVARAALALGRRLSCRGQSLDLASLALAALLHDVGKTSKGQELAGEREHGRASGEILRELGRDDLAGPVERHQIGQCLEPGWDPGLLEAIVYYADKVIGLRYMGLEERLDDMARRYPGLSDTIRLASPRLRTLEARLAEKCGLDRDGLERVLRVSQLQEGRPL